MGVSRSAYYGWLQRKPTSRDQVDSQLIPVIQSLFAKSRATYGTRRIRQSLEKQNWPVGRRRLGRLMRAAGLVCKTKRKFKVTTNSKHDLLVSDNLLDRNFTVHQANQAYVGDITYIRTQEGWLYLAVVIDLYSRQVVGWSLAEHMRTSLVNDALLMAIWKRKPPKGLPWHSDRGSQHAATSHRKIIKHFGIRQSMSRKGNCWDNAVAESFFHTLKTELIHHQTFRDREEAKQVVFECIEVFYNRERLHSANGYLSPVDYEAQQYAA
jgi:putative transposase